jgi:hypothetical protein
MLDVVDIELLGIVSPWRRQEVCFGWILARHADYTPKARPPQCRKLTIVLAPKILLGTYWLLGTHTKPGGKASICRVIYGVGPSGELLLVLGREGTRFLGGAVGTKDLWYQEVWRCFTVLFCV